MSKPDYSDNDPRGWCGDPKRGAAMGRASIHSKSSPTGKLYLRRVYLDRGGYDKNGTYFGIGTPIYWCADAMGEIDFTLRAHSRASAKAKARETYPNATFWR